MKGMRTAKPGLRILLYLPIRSTIHAVCWGTKRMMVLAGRPPREKYEPPDPPPGPAGRPYVILGAALTGPVESLRMPLPWVDGLVRDGAQEEVLRVRMAGDERMRFDASKRPALC